MTNAASTNVDGASSIFAHCWASRLSAECRLKSKLQPEPKPKLGNFRIDARTYPQYPQSSLDTYHPLCGASIAAIALSNRDTACGLNQTKCSRRNTAQLICGVHLALSSSFQYEKVVWPSSTPSSVGALTPTNVALGPTPTPSNNSAMSESATHHC